MISLVACERIMRINPSSGSRDNKVVAARAESDLEAAELVPLLADRPMRDGRATAYVCEDYACKRPTTDPEELKGQLGIS